jgi:hypothetical protein
MDFQKGRRPALFDAAVDRGGRPAESGELRRVPRRVVVACRRRRRRCPWQENPAAVAGFGRFGWRDPDSNRGHHDFQSWSSISQTAAKPLQIRSSAPSDGRGSITAIWSLFSSIWALRSVSVPNQDRSIAARAVAIFLDAVDLSFTQVALPSTTHTLGATRASSSRSARPISRDCPPSSAAATTPRGAPRRPGSAPTARAP